MKTSYCTLGDIFPGLKDAITKGEIDVKGPKEQKQDKSKIGKDMKTVKKTDKKANEKKREGIKDRY